MGEIILFLFEQQLCVNPSTKQKGNAEAEAEADFFGSLYLYSPGVEEGCLEQLDLNF